MPTMISKALALVIATLNLLALERKPSLYCESKLTYSAVLLTVDTIITLKFSSVWNVMVVLRSCHKDHLPLLALELLGAADGDLGKVVLFQLLPNLLNL